MRKQCTPFVKGSQSKAIKGHLTMDLYTFVKMVLSSFNTIKSKCDRYSELNLQGNTLGLNVNLIIGYGICIYTNIIYIMYINIQYQ